MMRQAALASVAGHVAAVLVWLWWPHPGSVELPAHFEVIFGRNATRDGAPTPAAATEPSRAAVSATPVAAAAALAQVATNAPLESRAVSAASPSASPGPLGDGKVGLIVEHPDASMVEAKADPGNRAPKYPDSAELAGEEGTVVLGLHIDPAGRVERTELLRSSGYADLDRAAAEALARWHFLPALRRGVAVPSYQVQPTDFRLMERG